MTLPQGSDGQMSPIVDLSTRFWVRLALCAYWRALLFWGLNPDPDFLPQQALESFWKLCPGPIPCKDVWGVGDTGPQDSDWRSFPELWSLHTPVVPGMLLKLVCDSMEEMEVMAIAALDGASGSSVLMQASVSLYPGGEATWVPPLLMPSVLEPTWMTLGSKDLPLLSPAVFSALPGKALGYFSHHLSYCSQLLAQPDQLTWLRLVSILGPLE